MFSVMKPARAYFFAVLFAFSLHVGVFLLMFHVSNHHESLVSMPVAIKSVQVTSVRAEDLAKAVASVKARQYRHLQQQKNKRRLAEEKLKQLRRSAQQVAKAKAEAARQLTKLRQQAKKTAAEQAHKKQALHLANKQLHAVKQKLARLVTKKKVSIKTKIKKKSETNQQLVPKHAVATTVSAEKLVTYQQAILKTIAQHWRLPKDIDPQLSCELLVDLAHNGQVLKVVLVRSSGNALLDSSARIAVFKASPLPLPSEQNLRQQFRQLHLTVRPEQVL